MFWIIHLLVGMAIASIISKFILIGTGPESVLVSNILTVLLIIVISFFSHFLFDMIPHWDGDFDRKGFVKTGKAKIGKSEILIRGTDFILTVAVAIILYYFFNLRGPYLYLGAFFSLLPDLIKVFYLTPLKKNKLYMKYLKFHGKIEGDASFWLGMLTQSITLIICLAIIFFLKL